jgi:hypothetical protein
MTLSLSLRMKKKSASLNKKITIRLKKFGEALAEARSGTTSLWQDIAAEIGQSSHWLRRREIESSIAYRWEFMHSKLSPEKPIQVMMQIFSDYYWRRLDPRFLQLEGTNRILLWLEEKYLKTYSRWMSRCLHAFSRREFLQQDLIYR